MKIAITIPQLNNQGGVASYFNSILPHLKSISNLQIICFNHGSKFGTSFSLHPITDQIRFNQFITLERPDLIHVNPSLNFNSFIRDGLLIWQAKQKSIPVLVFFHGWDYSFEKKLNKHFRFFFHNTYVKADKIIVLASHFKIKLHELGVQSKIILGTTAIDNSLLKNFDIKKKVSKINNYERINILFLSRIEKEKGVFETIDAFDMLIKKGFNNIHLSIAGEGTSFSDVKYYIKHIGIPHDKVSVLGHVTGKDKINTFTENDIFCFPSYGEGMPISVLEAMAFGLSVITTPVGGIKDFFENNKMGFLIKHPNPKSIANSIVKLIDNKQLLLDTIQYNHNYAKKKFMASTVSMKISKIYTSMA